MGISCKNKKDQIKYVTCLCKRCGKKFKSTIRVPLCEQCESKQNRKVSSSQLLGNDLTLKG